MFFISLNILIVDDTTPFSLKAQKFLSMCEGIGGVVIVGNDVDKIITNAKKITADIAFLNVRFLSEDPLVICKMLKKEVAGIKIVALTLYHSRGCRIAGAAVYFDGFISKQRFGDEVLKLIGKLFPEFPYYESH